MKIVDITEESLERKKDLEKVLILAKTHFEPVGCTVLKYGDDGLGISDGSRKIVAVFFSIINPTLTMYDSAYEEASLNFGKAYEKNSRDSLFKSLAQKDFILKKDYSRKR